MGDEVIVGCYVEHNSHEQPHHKKCKTILKLAVDAGKIIANTLCPDRDPDDGACQACERKAQAILNALAANQLAVVPRKPTEAMISQFGVEGSLMRLNAKNIWQAMFDAISPSPLSTGDRR